MNYDANKLPLGGVVSSFMLSHPNDDPRQTCKVNNPAGVRGPEGESSYNLSCDIFRSLPFQNLSEVIDNPDGDFAKEHGGLQAACEHFTSHYYS